MIKTMFSYIKRDMAPLFGFILAMLAFAGGASLVNNPPLYLGEFFVLINFALMPFFFAVFCYFLFTGRNPDVFKEKSDNLWYFMPFLYIYNFILTFGLGKTLMLKLAAGEFSLLGLFLFNLLFGYVVPGLALIIVLIAIINNVNWLEGLKISLGKESKMLGNMGGYLILAYLLSQAPGLIIYINPDVLAAGWPSFAIFLISKFIYIVFGLLLPFYWVLSKDMPKAEK